MHRLKETVRATCRFLLNPHFLLCFGLAWMVTNGWAYLGVAVGTLCRWTWLVGVATAYLTLLWIPFTPEKIITVFLAIWLLRRIYPNDKRTLAVLRAMQERHRNRKNKPNAKQDKPDTGQDRTSA